MHVAEFSEKQPKVRVNQVNGDKWFYIALNETEINQSDDNTNTSMTLYSMIITILWIILLIKMTYRIIRKSI